MARAVERWIRFVKGLAMDPRIPKRDKAILGVMIASLISPIDLIPDFIPIIGQLDDLVVILLMLDYLFNEIPIEILMDHYDGDERNLRKLRRRARFLAYFVPAQVKRRLWA